MNGCCSPLGPGPTPPGSGGSVSPVGFNTAGDFEGFGSGCCAGGVFPAPAVMSRTINAFSSGAAIAGMSEEDECAAFPSPVNAAFQPGASQSLVFNVVVTGGGSIPANSGTSLTVNVPGVLASDSVTGNQTSAVFSVGVAIVNTYASANGQVTMQIHNCTTSSQSIPSNFPFRVGVLRQGN